MITILLINLIGVSIYVAGVGLCLRTTKRTGNNGYLLLAGYFAGVLVVSSMEQVKRMQAGPTAEEYSQVAPPQGEAEGPEAGKETLPDADARQTLQPAGEPPTLAKGKEAAEQAVVSDSPWEAVTPPILPALLLAGVFMVSHDDPRRRAEVEDEPATDEGEDTPAENVDEVQEA